jgi:hypothetical protein
MLSNLFHDTVNILRRIDTSSASRDAFNNPVYGDPTTWNIVYTNLKLRLAFSGKGMKISSTGEILKPQGQGYCSKYINIRPEDRIIIVSSPGVAVGTEYVVESVWSSYLMNNVVDHFEFSFNLPIA